MTKDIKFQSIDVPFPKKLWVTAVWLVAHDGTELPIRLTLVKKSKISAIKYGKEAVTEIRAKYKPSNALDHITLIPLSFIKLHPLKRQYWEKGEIKLKDTDISKSFVTSLLHPASYYFLVTPTRYKNIGNKLILTGAFVFKKEDEDLLGELMKASSHPVNPEAKHVGIYEMGEPFYYDLAKKKEFIIEENLIN